MVYFDKLIGLTPLYSELDLKYQQVYSPGYTNLSACDEDCVVVAGVKDGYISGFGRPVAILGTDKAITAQIQRLYDISPDIYYMDFGGRLSAVSKFLLRKGLTARPYYTQIINLRKSTGELHADLRKSYKSIINSSQVLILPHSAIEDFRRLHIQMHGRETRKASTWDIQREMVEKGQAFILALHCKNRITGYCMFYLNHKSCYYACSASEPDTNTHAILWSAIMEAKKRGCETLELGEQVYFGKEKDVNVSLFKSGFGGETRIRLLFGKSEFERSHGL